MRRLFGLPALLLFNCGMLSAPARAEEALAQLETPQVRSGDLVVFLKPTSILGGPDQGKTAARGIVAICSNRTGQETWISGPLSGWAPSENIQRLESAQRLWERESSDVDATTRKAQLAYLQLRNHQRAAAQATFRQAKVKESDDLYVQVVAVLIDASADKRDLQSLEELVSQQRLTPELAATLVAGLRSIGARAHTNRLLELYHWDENEASVDLLLSAAEIEEEFKGNSQEAIRLLDLALDKDPFYGFLRHARAWVQYNQGKWKDAISDLEECRKHWPDDYRTLQLLGIYLIEDDDLDQGLAYIKASLELGPQKPTRFFGLGRRLLRNFMTKPNRNEDSPQLAMSVQLLESACQLDGYEKVEFIRGLCTAYAEQGKETEALILVKRQTNRYPPGDPRQAVLREIDDYITNRKLHNLIESQ